MSFLLMCLLFYNMLQGKGLGKLHILLKHRICPVLACPHSSKETSWDGLMGAAMNNLFLKLHIGCCAYTFYLLNYTILHYL